jgi:hypothetical protein
MPFGTSSWQARIAINTSQPSNYAAVGPVLAGDWGANNVNHYSDVMAQRRACWSINGGYALASGIEEQWRPLWSTAEFPIALHADGSSYHVRLQLGAAVGGTPDTTKWAVVLAPQGSARSVLGPSTEVPSTDAVWISDEYSSGTIAWMTGASTGPSSWATQVALTAAEATRYTRTVATLADVSGASASVRQCLVALSIFAWQKDSVAPPILHGFIADEWPG